MKRKTFIYIVIILVAIMFTQIIIYNLKEKNKKSTIYYNENFVTEDDIITSKIYPINTYKVFDIYKGPVQIEDFEGMIYKMIFENIPKINKNYSNKSQQEIIDDYNNNTSKINEMNIYTSDDLYLITQQIKNAYRDVVPVFDYVKIDENSIKDENGYCSFNIDVYFVNNQTISLKMYLTDTNTTSSKRDEMANETNAILPVLSNDKTIIVEDNSAIQKLYKESKEGFNKINAIETIQNIMDKAEQIKTDTRGYSINNEKQYYDLNKSDLSTLGIYSADDFVEFIGEIKKVSWNNQDKITGYTIDMSNMTNDTNYYIVDLYINYGNIDRISLKMSVSKQINIIPQIKIK